MEQRASGASFDDYKNGRNHRFAGAERRSVPKKKVPIIAGILVGVVFMVFHVCDDEYVGD
ncbi:MAG: hypothetical protein IPK08_23675 [Bacteroidetes bacterium]|nr:hypothetical protein [Bacteroidota bacterium]